MKRYNLTIEKRSDCLLRLPSLYDLNILASDNTIATTEKINEDNTISSNGIHLLYTLYHIIKLDLWN